MANDKEIVRNYFNSVGFGRWQRIYGDGEVNRVQAQIRLGHQKTVDNVLDWLKADGNLDKLTVCDAGCGVGSLSLPLADLGVKVFASDISEKMVTEAQSRAVNPSNPQFSVSDLETLSGTYDTVICLDVLIHYPIEDAKSMIEHLASLSQSRLILSFAPKTVFYSILKKVGDFFPGPSKATRAYLHSKAEITTTLTKAGFEIKRQALNSKPFYYSQLLEAVRIS